MNRVYKWKWLLLGMLAIAWIVPHYASAASNADEQAAAARMKALKLISGDKNGDLRLGDSITRAELVTIIVRSFGQDSSAKSLAGSKSFADTSGQWYSGYIAAAKSLVEKQGGSIGQPDGKFNPNGNVTAAEALAFMMKFLGVKPDTSKKWPDDYISAAVQAGLITADDQKQLDGTKNNKADRGLVFYLADQAFSSYKLAGGKSVYTTHLDKQPPTLTVDKYESTTEEDSIPLSGTVSADSTVTIGDNKATVGKDGKWKGTAKLKVGEKQEVAITATDLAGNKTVKKITIDQQGESVLDEVYGK